ncbi:enoyl-CoA hydratase [Gordonia sp. ABSL1-1]|uniref:enoyl-CoA hydratase n=1 Tax=Gordonia sp. ABSL1-1 TaxID=3053923 RepID=UPI002573C938|nr:enoyl-CoA hydratase [Gordonia sp. ABSL1-1]MDL9936487.1 enoyl-CoA hydratase [Gordonia sp. ABSL1-1]
MARRKRSLLVMFTAMLACIGVSMGAGAGEASPLRPLWKSTGLSDNFGTVGDHANCRGAMHIDLYATPHKPGYVRVSLTSFGFIGDGPGWRKDPHCRFLVGHAMRSSLGLERWAFWPASFGPKRGQRVMHDVRVGSGLAVFGIGTFQLHNPVRVPLSYGVNYYTIVP